MADTKGVNDAISGAVNHLNDAKKSPDSKAFDEINEAMYLLNQARRAISEKTGQQANSYIL